MKSRSSVIGNDLISGTAIIQFGLPPLAGSFATMSPKDRETDRRPGKTLHGPFKFVLPDIFARYTFPPASLIRLNSLLLSGLWSVDKGYIFLPKFPLMIPLESPTLAISHIGPTINAINAQLPLLSPDASAVRRNSSSH